MGSSSVIDAPVAAVALVVVGVVGSAASPSPSSVGFGATASLAVKGAYAGFSSGVSTVSGAGVVGVCWSCLLGRCCYF